MTHWFIAAKNKKFLKSAWLAVFFTAFIWLFEQWALPYRPHDFAEVFTPSLNYFLQVLSILLMLPFFWASFSGKIAVRWVGFVLFSLSVLTEYGYYYAMGRFSVLQDYYIGLDTLDLNYIRFALMAYMEAHLSSLLPIFVYTLILFLNRKSKDGGFLRFGAAVACILVFYSALYPFSRGTFPTLSTSAGFRTLTFTALKWANTYSGPRENVAVPPVQEQPKNNIIFVVEESLRCDHLSLNGYNRPTTPYLQLLQQKGQLTNWGMASSMGTSSLNSNTLLLTGVNQLPDLNQEARKMPTIFQYAKAMGYETYVMDAQMDRSWLLKNGDSKYVDHQKLAGDFLNGIPSYDVDFAAASYIHSLVTNSSGKFIWINKMGVHFPYEARYPKEKSIWKPTLPDFQYDSTKKAEITNSYDNAIAYNVDEFIRKVIGDKLPENTFIVYTSDHGQTLSENGETWPHSGPTRMEACVPLFIISETQIQADAAYKASHANVFATLLDLMDYPQGLRSYSFSPSLFKAKSTDTDHRQYIFGILDSYNSSQVFNFDPVPDIK
jgi:glucan phosphoethanolaminetransferase (alkaline phosphatase superfamily)